MNEIKCPHCQKIFTIDESDYESIAKQIRNQEFTKEISIRQEQYEKDKTQALALQRSELEKKYQEEHNQLVSKKENELSKKDLEIIELKNRLELENKTFSNELENKLQDKNQKISQLQQELKTKEELAEASALKKYQEQIFKQSQEIEKLKNDLQLQATQNKLELQEKINQKNKEIDTLNNQLTSSKNEFLLKESNLKEQYTEKLRAKEEQIEYYKDFKARQSTKMIGESLEVHCSNEFNKLRPLFKNAYFEKDNDIKTGSKGDFIYRDFDDENTEIVSIMFEMKNESDTTATKHKNEDFFKELDKDRKEKNCEYAVLVSLLEKDNDYYNNGIVDVSHKYPKMYVIRPQFFIPLITLIRGMALNSLEYKKELALVRNQNIDIAHFEENMNNFKNTFSRNYRLASEKFTKAIEEIDKTINHLQKTKEALLSSDKNLRLANDKVEKLTIKKLTINSKTVADMFANLKEKDIQEDNLE